MRAALSSSTLLKALALVALVGGTVGVALVLPPGASSTTNQTLFGDRAADRVETVEGINATVHTVIRRQNGTTTGTTRSVERVSRRPQTGELRAVLRYSTEKRWDRRVANGSGRWLYDADTSEADWIDDTAEPTRTKSQSDHGRLARIFERLARSRTTRQTPAQSTPGINPLPAVPHGQATTTRSTTGGQFGVRYVGNRTVDDHTTYLVRIEPRSKTEGTVVENYTQRLWLDSEYFYPLKRQTSWERDGVVTTITTTYRNVTFNPGLSDSLFEFEPPANATLEDDSDGPTQRAYGSITALRTTASMSVPTPRVPDSFRFVIATRTQGRVRSTGLQYSNATAELGISKSNLTWYQPRTDGSSVSINSRDGEFRDLGPEQRVSWTCDEWRYSVSGTGLSKTTLVDVAESVSCE